MDTNEVLAMIVIAIVVIAVVATLAYRLMKPKTPMGPPSTPLQGRMMYLITGAGRLADGKVVPPSQMEPGFAYFTSDGQTPIYQQQSNKNITCFTDLSSYTVNGKARQGGVVTTNMYPMSDGVTWLSEKDQASWDAQKEAFKMYAPPRGLWTFSYKSARSAPPNDYPLTTNGPGGTGASCFQ